jgi:hypothetical protein
MSYLFSKQQDPTQAATKTACSKLSNNAALVVHELAREPAQGLMHVAVSVWLMTKQLCMHVTPGRTLTAVVSPVPQADPRAAEHTGAARHQPSAGDSSSTTAGTRRKTASTHQHVCAECPAPTLAHLCTYCVALGSCFLCPCQAVLAELQDAQEGILSITGPATQQDLAALAASLESAAQQLEQQHQQQHQQQQQQQQQGAGATRTAASTGNSRLLKLFAAGASGSSSPAGSVQGS